ncbi:MAG: GGDEF domain-containing protein [Chloroflexota bacterium]
MNTGTMQLQDELTGLLTRKAFHETLDGILEKHKGVDAPLSLAFIDVDNFFNINEQYGHAGGDDVLKALADMIKLASGSAGLPSRYGGDEFVIIFPDLEREQAFLTIEKLRETVERTSIKLAKAGIEINGISISAGIACYPMDGRLKSELLRKADQALYRAKVTGRSKVRLAYDEKMLPKTSHYTQTQLERLTKLAAERQAGEAELMREALDDLLGKYGVNEIERWG